MLAKPSPPGFTLRQKPTNCGLRSLIKFDSSHLAVEAEVVWWSTYMTPVRYPYWMLWYLWWGSREMPTRKDSWRERNNDLILSPNFKSIACGMVSLAARVTKWRRELATVCLALNVELPPAQHQTMPRSRVNCSSRAALHEARYANSANEIKGWAVDCVSEAVSHSCKPIGGFDKMSSLYSSLSSHLWHMEDSQAGSAIPIKPSSSRGDDDDDENDVGCNDDACAASVNALLQDWCPRASGTDLSGRPGNVVVDALEAATAVARGTSHDKSHSSASHSLSESGLCKSVIWQKSATLHGHVAKANRFGHGSFYNAYRVYYAIACRNSSKYCICNKSFKCQSNWMQVLIKSKRNM